MGVIRKRLGNGGANLARSAILRTARSTADADRVDLAVIVEALPS
jgi:hypothetical protein